MMVRSKTPRKTLYLTMEIDSNQIFGFFGLQSRLNWHWPERLDGVVCKFPGFWSDNQHVRRVGEVGSLEFANVFVGLEWPWQQLEVAFLVSAAAAEGLPA